MLKDPALLEPPISEEEYQRRRSEAWSAGAGTELAEEVDLEFIARERDLSGAGRLPRPGADELPRLPDRVAHLVTGTPTRPGRVVGKYKPDTWADRIRPALLAPVILAAVVVATVAATAVVIRSL